MYFATFDPFLRAYRDHPATYRQFIDAPPYRFGRIGFSLLTKLFSGDRWQLYPATMMWLIMGALFLCGLALALLAIQVGATPWWGALALAVPGFWQSLQSALPEPIAAALLLVGYLCLVRSKWWWAGALFAVSLLVRETGAILVVCLTAAMAMSGQRREAIRVAAIALVPLLAWRLYVGSVLFGDWGVQAFLFNPAGLGVPFAGVLELWAVIHRGQYYPDVPALARAGVWYPVVVAAGFASATMLAVRLRNALGMAALLYAGMAITLQYASVWVHVGNAQRVTYEMFVALALLTVGIGRYSPMLRASLWTFWSAAVVYVLFGAHDAWYVREAMLAPLAGALGI
jgi:hypothetical protein